MKRYKVVGSQPIDDGKGGTHVPGTEFSGSPDDFDEAFLTSIGAIEVVEEKTSKRAPKAADGEDDGD